MTSTSDNEHESEKKLGLGTGIGLGVPFLLGLIAIVWWAYTHKRKRPVSQTKDPQLTRREIHDPQVSELHGVQVSELHDTEASLASELDHAGISRTKDINVRPFELA
jgi:hypothetical protein